MTGAPILLNLYTPYSFPLIPYTFLLVNFLQNPANIS